jgi:hypothetical protein
MTIMEKPVPTKYRQNCTKFALIYGYNSAVKYIYVLKW